MNKYQMTLTFLGVSESISVNIAANSAEDALASIQAGNGTVLHIGSGSSNKSCPDTVSHVYIETIHISKDEITDIYRRIFLRGTEENSSQTVRFPDGMEMDISCCKDREETGWTEAVLFHNGNECGLSDVEEKYEGLWSICRNGIMYIAVIVPEATPWITPNIILLPGSCLDSTAQVIAHQTNCKGVMGAGVALAIRKKYPEIVIEYQEACFSRNMLGQCQLIATEDERYIANLFGQNYFGSGRQTDYAALQSALDSLVDLMQSRGLTSLSMPYNLGCGLAGGDWNIVFEMIKEAFTGKNIRVELWKLD